MSLGPQRSPPGRADALATPPASARGAPGVPRTEVARARAGMRSAALRLHSAGREREGSGGMKQGQGELKREGMGGNEIMGITACVRQHVRGSMSGLQTTVKIHIEMIMQ